MLLSLIILDYRVLIPLTQTQKGIVDEKDRLEAVYYCISLTRKSRTVLEKKYSVRIYGFPLSCTFIPAENVCRQFPLLRQLHCTVWRLRALIARYKCHVG